MNSCTRQLPILLLVLFGFTLFGELASAQSKEAQEEANQEVKEAIKSAIPAATAMGNADWENLTTSRAAKIPPVSPMGVYIRIAMTDEDSAEKRAEFGYVGSAPDPAKLAREVSRGDHRTWIKADRITEMTCQVEDDTASGTIEYLVPDLVRGKFQYTAKRVDKKWKITGFKMPAHKIELVRNEAGDWEQKEWKEEK